MTNELITRERSLLSYTADLSAKLQFCKILLSSAMCPAHFKNEADVLSCILYGDELGFSPMQALQTLYVVNGIPTLPSAGIKAKIQQAGGRFETISWNEKHCKLRCFRGEISEEFEYTIEDAVRAKLTTKDVWQRHPKQMLYARASTVLGRNMYADVLKGIQCREEIEDEQHVAQVVKTEKFTGISTSPVEVVEPEVVTETKLELPKTEGFYCYDLTLIDESNRADIRGFFETSGFKEVAPNVFKTTIKSKKYAKAMVAEPTPIETPSTMQDDVPGDYAQAEPLPMEIETAKKENNIEKLRKRVAAEKLGYKEA